jgi:hypothetical protein
VRLDGSARPSSLVRTGTAARWWEQSSRGGKSSPAAWPSLTPSTPPSLSLNPSGLVESGFCHFILVFLISHVEINGSLLNRSIMSSLYVIPLGSAVAALLFEQILGPLLAAASFVRWVSPALEGRQEGRLQGASRYGAV